MINKSADISLRAQVLTLFYCTTVNDQFIAAVTGYSLSQIYKICHIAKDRGFDSDVSLQILNKYVTHAVKSGQSIKTTVEKKMKSLNVRQKTAIFKKIFW